MPLSHLIPMPRLCAYPRREALCRGQAVPEASRSSPPIPKVSISQTGSPTLSSGQMAHCSRLLSNYHFLEPLNVSFALCFH